MFTNKVTSGQMNHIAQITFDSPIVNKSNTFAICGRPSVCNIRAPYPASRNFRQCYYAA